MSSLASALNRYLAAGGCYGLVRKSIDLCVLGEPLVTVQRDLVQDAEGRFGYVSRNRPMLVTEKLAVVAVHACINLVYSPYYVALDLQRAEACARGIDIYPTAQKGRDDPELCLWHHMV